MLVHGDVKPENMLVGTNNEILLSDFDIAAIAEPAGTHNAQAGTITYIAPEQIQGNPRPASDQFALGVVLYEWLCGLPPFTGMVREVALQHERTQPPSLRERVPVILPEVAQVVLIALAKDPQSRFSSVQAFANAFEQASQLAPSSVQPSSFVPLPDAQLDKPTEVASYQQTPPPYLADQTPRTAYGVQGPYNLFPYPEPQPAYAPPPPMPTGSQETYPASATPPGQVDPYTPSTPYVAPQTGTQPTGPGPQRH